MAALMLSSSLAGAQDSGYHIGDLVIAQNLPFCLQRENAEAIADYARKHGSGYDEFMKLSQCRSGRGIVIVGQQLDKFPDSSATSGFRYVVEFFLNGYPKMPLYGIFDKPVTIPLSPPI